jgi:biotin carboxylase
VSTADASAIAEVCRSTHAHGIVTAGSERALTSAARAAVLAKLPFYADEETVRRAQEKDAMRAAFAAAGLRCPAFARCASLADVERFVGEYGFAVVVKPGRGWGQRGVTRVDERSQLETAVRTALAACADALSTGPRTGTATGAATTAPQEAPWVVVESCIEGREYSANGWVVDAEAQTLCITERRVFPGRAPLGVMEAEVFPSGLPAATEQRIRQEVARAARAVGLRRGPCYVQLAIDRTGEPWVFEIAARLGGGFDADVTLLATGVDLYQRLLGVALGHAAWEHAGVTGPVHRAALVRFIPPAAGTVEQVQGLAEVRAVPGVVAADTFVSRGSVLGSLTDASKRAAYILCVGESRDAAWATSEKARSLLHIHTALTERTPP